MQLIFKFYLIALSILGLKFKSFELSICFLRYFIEILHKNVFVSLADHYLIHDFKLVVSVKFETTHHIFLSNNKMVYRE